MKFGHLVLVLLACVFVSSAFADTDNFGSYRRGLDSPVETIVEAVPNDDADLPFRPRGIFVKDTGVVSFLDKNGTTITFSDGEIATGVWHPMRPVRILETTTATILIGE